MERLGKEVTILFGFYVEWMLFQKRRGLRMTSLWAADVLYPKNVTILLQMYFKMKMNLVADICCERDSNNLLCYFGPVIFILKLTFWSNELKDYWEKSHKIWVSANAQPSISCMTRSMLVKVVYFSCLYRVKVPSDSEMLCFYEYGNVFFWPQTIICSFFILTFLPSFL